MGVSLVSFVDVNLPGAHFHNRALFFLYLIFPILVSLWVVRIATLKKLKKPIAIFLVVVSLMNLLTIFYIENEAIISDSNLNAANFVISSSTNESIYVEQAAIIKAFAPERDILRLSRGGKIPNGSILIFDEYAMVSEIV